MQPRLGVARVWPSLGEVISRGHAREPDSRGLANDQRHSRVLECDRGDDEHVEELVIAKHAR